MITFVVWVHVNFLLKISAFFVACLYTGMYHVLKRLYKQWPQDQWSDYHPVLFLRSGYYTV